MVYSGLDEARTVLSEMDIVLTARQMKCADDRDAKGRRTLPCFIEAIEGTLRIEKQDLINARVKQPVDAHRQCRPKP